MKVFKYEIQSNTGILIKTNETIKIRKNTWVDKNNISHVMKCIKSKSFENKNVYILYYFGDVTSPKVVHISLSFLENQKFNWLQKKHWLQKEENIRYIINIIFLICGIIIGFFNYIKNH